MLAPRPPPRSGLARADRSAVTHHDDAELRDEDRIAAAKELLHDDW
jgi:hypothetical protein